MQECGKVASVPIIYHHSSKYLIKVPRDSAHPRKLHRTEVPWRPSWPQCTRAGILIHWATSRKSHTPTRIDGNRLCPKACIWVLTHIHAYIWYTLQYQFSCSVLSNSLRPYGLQHCQVSLSFPDPVLPGVYSDSCLLSWWWHTTVSSSVVPTHPALNLSQNQSFSHELLFTSGGQSSRVSASALVLSVNIQVWFPLGLTDLI